MATIESLHGGLTFSALLHNAQQAEFTWKDGIIVSIDSDGILHFWFNTENEERAVYMLEKAKMLILLGE